MNMGIRMDCDDIESILYVLLNLSSNIIPHERLCDIKMKKHIIKNIYDN